MPESPVPESPVPDDDVPRRTIAEEARPGDPGDGVSGDGHSRALAEKLRAAVAELSPDLAGLRARFAARANRAGLVDVAYDELDSPLGPLLAAVTEVGLVRLAFVGLDAAVGRPDAVLDDLAARLSPRVVRVPGRLDAVRRQLEEYFGGRRQRFALGLDWSLSLGFRRRVLKATAGIPYGATGTYRSVAGGAGNPRAARAAGTALATNPIVIVVPCHRVLSSDGSLGGYGGGPAGKRTLLALEAGTARP